MDEHTLRALVRQTLARQLQPQGPMSSPPQLARDASHYRYVLPETDGPCLIEPTVQCNHCGYCQSHGH